MKSVFSKAEHDVLIQYKHGETVLYQHQAIIDKWAGKGFVAIGITEDAMEATAKITPLGLKHL